MEGELAPMAEELGLGVLPWSPLKSGLLSGKYTRANGEKVQGRRSGFVGQITDKQYDIIDAVARVAQELGAEPAAVALAWVHGQPAVTSTIIGARTMAHLEANLKGLDLQLSAEQSATLDEVSKPVLNFPAEFNRNNSPNYAHAGATVNGRATTVVPLVPTDETQRW